MTQVRSLLEAFCLDAHVPGLAFGLVRDGQLASFEAVGVQDLVSARPVTADSLFRIASMTKVFTALTVLKLRDEGLLALDALAEDHVPELRGWVYPTDDAPRIRIRDLLNHCAGFVTDDPWGDRQQTLPETEFTRFLQSGVPFTRAPGLAYEYSNLGYALLGRVIANARGEAYDRVVADTLLQPLHMNASGYDMASTVDDRRALGYRWEDAAWRSEPMLEHGAFGAMGGLHTCAADYARWVAFLLAAWPARNGPETGPVRRSTVRELAQGSNFPRLRGRNAGAGSDSPAVAVTYGMGLEVTQDPVLGLTLSHSGGYPGYGSHMLLLPERGIGLFGFASRTYAAPAGVLWDIALALDGESALGAPRGIVSGDALNAAYDAAQAIYAAGRVHDQMAVLAMNFLLDRDADGWTRDLLDLKTQAGRLLSSQSFTPSGALSATFVWCCAQGRIRGTLQLAPTTPPTIQTLRLALIQP